MLPARKQGRRSARCYPNAHRFYDADGGSVAVGGHDVRSLQLDSLRAAIATVPQVRTGAMQLWRCI
jgi:hypothetical protein